MLTYRLAAGEPSLLGELFSRRRPVLLLTAWNLHTMTLLCSKCRKVEAVVWICASLALGHYGDGKNDTIHILQHHPAVDRPALAAAGILAALNGAIFIYVQIYLRMVQGVYKDPELAAQWAVPSAGCAGVLCASFMVYSCWGVWSWFTPAIGLVHLLALVNVINAIPSFGLPQAKVD
jgi:hypothetical protein